MAKYSVTLSFTERQDSRMDPVHAKHITKTYQVASEDADTALAQARSEALADPLFTTREWIVVATAVRKI